MQEEEWLCMVMEDEGLLRAKGKVAFLRSRRRCETRVAQTSEPSHGSDKKVPRPVLRLFVCNNGVHEPNPKGRCTVLPSQHTRTRATTQLPRHARASPGGRQGCIAGYTLRMCVCGLNLEYMWHTRSGAR